MRAAGIICHAGCKVRYPSPGGTVEGEVIAVSFDKFFLRVDGNVQPFAVGQLRMPEVGKSISVTYSGGRPPTSLEIQDEPASSVTH